MMFYGKEEPVVMPSMEVYNTDLAKMYIAGLKEQYDARKKEMDDLITLYNKFESSVPGANEAYYDITLGKANEALRDIESQGLDPFKNPMAWGIISLKIREANGPMAKRLQAQAKDYDEMLKARRELEAKGLYNAPFEKWRMENAGLLDELGNPVAIKDGKVVDYSLYTPAEFKDLRSLTENYFKGLERLKKVGSDGMYDIMAVGDDALGNATTGSIESLKTTPYFDYYLQEAAKQAQAANPDKDITPADIMDQLRWDIKEANRDQWQDERVWNKEKEFWTKYNQKERHHKESTKEPKQDGEYSVIQAIQDSGKNSAYHQYGKLMVGEGKNAVSFNSLSPELKQKYILRTRGAYAAFNTFSWLNDAAIGNIKYWFDQQSVPLASTHGIETPGTFVITNPLLIDRLTTRKDIEFEMAGVKDKDVDYKKHSAMTHLRKKLIDSYERGDYIIVKTRNRGVNPVVKDGGLRIYQSVEVKIVPNDKSVSKNTNSSDNLGEFIHTNDKGEIVYIDDLTYAKRQTEGKEKGKYKEGDRSGVLRFNLFFDYGDTWSNASGMNVGSTAPNIMMMDATMSHNISKDADNTEGISGNNYIFYK